MKRKALKRILVAIGVLAVVSSVAIQWLMSEQRIIDLIESRYDCECTVGDVSYSFFYSTAEITDLKLHDPVAKRDFVTAKSLRLELSGIFSELKAEKLELIEPTILYTVDDDGIANWRRLRRKKTKDKKPSDRVDEQGRRLADEESDLEDIIGATITDGTVIYENLPRDLVVIFRDLQISSENAEKGNFAVSATIDASRQNPTAQFAQLETTGTAHYRNDEFISLDLTFAGDSYITRDLPLLRNAWAKLAKWQRAIPRLNALPDRVDFRRNRELALDLRADTIRTRTPFAVKSRGFQLELQPGAEFDTVTTHQSSTFVLGATREATESFIAKARSLIKKLPRQLRRPTERLLTRRIVKDGQLHLELKSSGQLSKASFDLKEALPSMEDLLKQGARDALLDLIR